MDGYGERVWYSPQLQSHPSAVDEGLEEGLVVGDGLQDVAVVGDVADGPLAQSGAAQSEDVAGRSEAHTHTLIEDTNKIKLNL